MTESPDPAGTKKKIKELIVRQLRLKIPDTAIEDDQPLFGPALGLDSIDALELVVGLEKEFGVSLSDPKVARKTIESVNTIHDFLRRHGKP